MTQQVYKLCVLILAVALSGPLVAKSKLTDEEHLLSQDYVDEIGAQGQIQKECEKLGDPLVCQGRAAKTKFLGANSQSIQMAAKMYAMVMPAIGLAGGGDFTKRGEEGGKAKDYCQYIATAVEGIAKMKQQAAQQHLANLPENQATRQKDTLYKAARSHEERASNHKIQAVGWTAITACYAAYLPVSFGDWKLYAKMGAAGFLAAFFTSEVKAHREYAAKIRKIADGLPGPGDCNPVTDTHCFCSKPKVSAADLPHYQKYCIPYLHKRQMAESSYHVPCTNQSLRPDAQCTCIREDTCFDKKYFTDIKLPHLQPFLSSPEGEDVRALMRGELKGGRLSGRADAAGKRAIGILRKAAGDKVPKARALNPRQGSDARLIESMGVPRPLAALTAGSAPAKATFPGWAKGAVGALPKRKGKASKSSKNQVWKFNQAKGLNRAKASKKKGFDPNRLLKQLGKKKGPASASGNKILTFAPANREVAQVHRQDNRNLFDIVSYRYKISAWRRLQVTP